MPIDQWPVSDKHMQEVVRQITMRNAAPDLYAALESIVHQWEHHADLDTNHAAFVKAKAALAKARGESQR